MREVEEAFRRMRGREGFRLTHYSIQGNHLHAIVEASDTDALGRGMMSLGIRFARAVNRALRRKGPVVWDRYHAKVLKTPTQVRNAIRYVLLNARRHAAQARRSKQLPRARAARPGVVGALVRGVEVAAAGRGRRRGASPPAVSQPRTWLLAAGWRLRGLLDPSDVPGRA